MPKKTKRKAAKRKIRQVVKGKMARKKAKAALKKPTKAGTELAPVSLIPTALGFTSGISIREEGGELVAEARIPGAKADEIKVEVQPNSIRVWAERKENGKETGKGYYYESSSYGSESKYASLPQSVEPKSAKVSAREGSVEVRMRKKG